MIKYLPFWVYYAIIMRILDHKRNCTKENLGAMDFGKGLGDVIVKYMLPMICVIAVLWALWIAAQFLMAKDEAGRKNAKKRLLSAIGCVMIFVMLTSILMYANLQIQQNPFEMKPPANLVIDGGGSSGGGGGGWVPSPGSKEPPIPLPKQKYGLVSPIRFDGNNPTDIKNMAIITADLQAKVSGNGLIFAETMSGMYGRRKIFLNGDEEQFKITDSAYQYALAGKYKDGAYKWDTGRYEDNFALEIDADMGEGLGWLSSIYALDETSFNPSIPLNPTNFVPPTPYVGYFEGKYASNTVVLPGIMAADVVINNLDEMWTAPYTAVPNETYTSPIGMALHQNARTGGVLGEVPGLSFAGAVSEAGGTMTSLQRGGTVASNFVSIWQNPSKTGTVLNTTINGRRTMAEARAIADGIVVAAGNTETDSPYDEAWVVIRHDSPLPGGRQTYTYYGGLYGAVRMHEDLIRIYNTSPYNVDTERVSEDILFKGASEFGGEYEYEDEDELDENGKPVIKKGEQTPSIEIPKDPSKIQVSKDYPIINKPGTNFGPGYFVYDGVVFNSNKDNYLTKADPVTGVVAGPAAGFYAANSAKHSISEKMQGGVLYKHKTGLLLTNDSKASSGAYQDDFNFIAQTYNYKKGIKQYDPYTEGNSERGKGYWFPTSVFNQDFDIDYNYYDKVPTVIATGGNKIATGIAWESTERVAAQTFDAPSNNGGYDKKHGTYDRNLIGRRVHQGDFIGYIGGGLLDPGAGQKRASTLGVKPGNLGAFYTGQPIDVPDIVQIIKDLANPLNVAQEIIDAAVAAWNTFVEVTIGPATHLAAAGDVAVNEFSGIQPTPAQLAASNIYGKIMADAAVEALQINPIVLPEIPTPLSMGNVLYNDQGYMRGGKYAYLSNRRLDIIPGVNTFTNRHLKLQMFGANDTRTEMAMVFTPDTDNALNSSIKHLPSYEVVKAAEKLAGLNSVTDFVDMWADVIQPRAGAFSTAPGECYNPRQFFDTYVLKLGFTPTPAGGREDILEYAMAQNAAWEGSASFQTVFNVNTGGTSTDKIVGLNPIPKSAGCQMTGFFGDPRRNASGSGTHEHKGVDLIPDAKTYSAMKWMPSTDGFWILSGAVQVNAAGSGTVTSVGWDSAGGFIVKIKLFEQINGKDVVLKYMHLDGTRLIGGDKTSILVEKDDIVVVGQPIADMGGTGITKDVDPVSTKPHLHFEVWVGDTAVNPTKHINFFAFAA
jgi:murein DD-endopeptidase MepM/ murein hydrolase activator NlpD